MLYQYNQLLNRPIDAHPYGYPLYRHCFLFKEGDVFKIARDGKLITEIHPDGTIYLHLWDYLTTGVKNAWSDHLGIYEIDSKRRKSVTGRSSHTLTFRVREQDSTKKPNGYSYAWSYRTLGTVNATKRIKVNVVGDSFTFENADPFTKIEKDKEKYAEFNAKLKKLKSVLFTQAKMGAYNDYVDMRHNTRNELMACVPEYAVHNRLWGHEAEQVLYNYVTKWMEDGDVQHLKPIGVMCLHNHYSELTGHQGKEPEAAKRRITSGLKWVQGEFLRRECLTIEESNNSLTPSDESHDQNSELLPSAGLREVPVPSEAQVC